MYFASMSEIELVSRNHLFKQLSSALPDSLHRQTHKRSTVDDRMHHNDVIGNDLFFPRIDKHSDICGPRNPLEAS